MGGGKQHAEENTRHSIDPTDSHCMKYDCVYHTLLCVFAVSVFSFGVLQLQLLDQHLILLQHQASLLLQLPPTHTSTHLCQCCNGTIIIAMLAAKAEMKIYSLIKRTDKQELTKTNQKIHSVHTKFSVQRQGLNSAIHEMHINEKRK